MSPVATVPERFYQALGRAAERLQLREDDPALELAGRLGIRRFIQRHASGDSDFQESSWVDHGVRLRKEVRELSGALEDSGVRHFFFKGIGLVGELYRVDDRRFDDMDVVIDPTDRSAALAIFHARGFAELGDRNQWRAGTERPGITMSRDDPTTGEPDTAALLDVHWGLEPVSMILPEGEITLPPTVWEGVEVRHRVSVPVNEHHAALVLHHLVRHDLLHVRGFLDFALLWEAMPQDGGGELSNLAAWLGVSRALGVIARVMVDDLHLFPLRGVRLGPWDWRGRAILRRARLADVLVRAARHAGASSRHVTVTRSLAWHRYLLADAARGRRLLGELLAPPKEYLRWRWPEARSNAGAWRRHVVAALGS